MHYIILIIVVFCTFTGAIGVITNDNLLLICSIFNVIFGAYMLLNERKYRFKAFGRKKNT